MPLVIDDSAPSNRLVEYVLRVDIFAFFHQRIIFYFCDTCGKQFSRLFNMQRHVRNVHKQGSYTKPQGSHTKHWLVDQPPFIRLLRYTCINNLYQPASSRIVWCHRQWQPIHFRPVASSIILRGWGTYSYTRILRNYFF